MLALKCPTSESGYMNILGIINRVREDLDEEIRRFLVPMKGCAKAQVLGKNSRYAKIRLTTTIKTIATTAHEATGRTGIKNVDQ